VLGFGDFGGGGRGWAAHDRVLRLIPCKIMETTRCGALH
jgi:hypothetical protein